MSEIPIRTNLHLWLLTGRHKDFVNSPLNLGVEYSMRSCPPEVVHLRALLGLADRNTDLHVLAVYAATRMGTSMLRDEIADNEAVFARGMLSLPRVACTAGMHPLTDSSWPYVDGGRAGEDGFTILVIQVIDSDRVSLTTDGGASDISEYTVIPQDGGVFRVWVHKAAEYGVHASFEVSSWSAGDQIIVSFSPTRYPFRKVVERITPDPVVIDILNSQGCLGAFGETSNYALKLGLVGLAIIRRMTQELNEDQPGYSVDVTLDTGGSDPLKKEVTIEPVFTAGLVEAPVTVDEPEGFNV